MEQSTKDRIEIIRAQTRAAAFLIPLATLCIALFVVDDVKDTIVGAVITAATAASIFYYKKFEDG